MYVYHCDYAIPTPCFSAFWYFHPYIFLHFLKMFFLHFNIMNVPAIGSVRCIPGCMKGRGDDQKVEDREGGGEGGG